MDTWLTELLAAIPVHLRRRTLYLAFSGGLDSRVLLHGLLALREKGLLDEVQLLHVHHGLLTEADEWAEEAQHLGAQLNVSVQVLRVEVDRQSGQGVEAAARKARYAALTGVMRAGDVLLTAHHQDDQAETFLLQLMRGAGVRGLAAMPSLQPVSLRDGEGWHLRPLLHVSRAALLQQALRLGLTWVDDPSNADLSLARNHVRHEVLPVLMQHWPSARQTLARCAGRMASTEGLLRDLARIDLHDLRSEDGRRLNVGDLLRLSVPRRQNALRAWLLELGLPALPEARLDELSRVLAAREDALPHVAWPGGALVRWRDGLYAVSEAALRRQAHLPDWSGCLWSVQQPLDLPALGVRLVPAQALGRGLDAARVQQGLHVHVRSSLTSSSARATLGKRFQALAIPPWGRAHVPLLYLEEHLVQVGNDWLAPAYRAQGQRSGIVVDVESLSESVT